MYIMQSPQIPLNIIHLPFRYSIPLQLKQKMHNRQLRPNLFNILLVIEIIKITNKILYDSGDTLQRTFIDNFNLNDGLD